MTGRGSPRRRNRSSIPLPRALYRMDAGGGVMGQDDAELVRRWRRGEPAAFEELVRRWEQPVARFLYRFAGPAAPLQDLCQEVFLKVYRAGPGYRETGAFSTWLFQIALNVARDDGRRRRHQPVPLADQDVASAADPA